MSSIIFTHGDCDGICAGAVVKSALPDSIKDKLSRDMRQVAIYGAIGDFSETPLIKKWERDWDTRTLYFYAF